MMILIWLGVLILFVIAEAATYLLVSIWFAVGALVALIATALSAPLWLQITLFIVASAAAIYFTRPLAKKYIYKKKTHTNADKALDMVGVVKERIDNIAGTGLVHVDGKDWTARSDNGEPIEAEERVRAVRIEGVKLMVLPVAVEPESSSEKVPVENNS